jgi:uncharacterized protein
MSKEHRGGWRWDTRRRSLWWVDPNAAQEEGIVPTTALASARRRTIAWSKEEPFGAEFAVLELDRDRLSGSGVAIGSAPEPYGLDYTLDCAAGFLTTHLSIAAVGDGWRRKLTLRREQRGWSAEVEQNGTVALPDAGGEMAVFADALDPDLGLSPLFNTLPVLRHGLHTGWGAEDFTMVWISVPDLGLHLSAQRYTHLQDGAHGEHIVRFEAAGEGEDFTADIVFDDDGLVIDYPGIASRLRRSA